MISAVKEAASGALLALTIIYVRLSREQSIAKGLSIPAQIREGNEYAERNGYENVLVLTEEEATPGKTPFEKRKAGAELLQLIHEGKVKRLVVRDLDRLMRDLKLWTEIREAILEHDVELHTFSGQVRLDTAANRFVANIAASYSELESSQGSERVRRSKKQLAVSGRHLGGPPPYGYVTQASYAKSLSDCGIQPDEARRKSELSFSRRGFLYKDEKEAMVILKIFEMYLGGMGCRQICNKLNEEGYHRRSGKPWHPDKVRRVINDPVLCGMIPHDEEHYARGGRGKRAASSIKPVPRFP